jgi:hypothetical protein
MRFIVIHASRSHHGGFAVGVGALGRALWVQREPLCHRWSVWRTDPATSVGCSDLPPGFGSAGVREPRRPPPGGLSGGVRMTPPDRGAST